MNEKFEKLLENPALAFMERNLAESLRRWGIQLGPDWGLRTPDPNAGLNKPDPLKDLIGGTPR